MKVLIVSASAPERRRAASGLADEAPVEVVEVARPFDARHRVAAGDVDVLVIDGDLEPMGGFSLLYEIRADGELEQRPSPPALVLTSRTEDEWLADWAGANRTLRKPVDPFRLAAIVDELAGARPAVPDTATGTESVREITDRRTGASGLAPEPGVAVGRPAVGS